MSTWPNRGGLRRPLRGGPEERENPKTQTANLSIRSTRSDSSQQASTKPGVVHAVVLDQLTDRPILRERGLRLEPLRPEDIKRIREASHVSQAVFARLLNTSLNHPGFRGGLLA